MRDRFDHIAVSLMSRGQAASGGAGEAIAALGVMLFLALWRALLSQYRERTANAHQRARGFTARFGGATRYAPPGIVVMLAIGLAAASASAEPANSPVGDWTTANGHGVVAIAPCGDALCGRIVGIDRKPTEPIPTDVNGRSQCGLTIISNERPQSDGTFLGQVTDPRDGGVYGAKLWLDSEGNLRLRGFIGIPALGSTQTWHRFMGNLTAGCGLV